MEPLPKPQLRDGDCFADSCRAARIWSLLLARYYQQSSENSVNKEKEKRNFFSAMRVFNMTALTMAHTETLTLKNRVNSSAEERFLPLQVDFITNTARERLNFEECRQHYIES